MYTITIKIEKNSKQVEKLVIEQEEGHYFICHHNNGSFQFFLESEEPSDIINAAYIHYLT
jgi:hypothetical protein